MRLRQVRDGARQRDHSGRDERSAEAPAPRGEAQPPRTQELREIGAEPHRVDGGATPRGRHRFAGEAREDHEGDAVQRPVAYCEREEERPARSAPHADERGRHADQSRNEHRASTIAVGHASAEESTHHGPHLRADEEDAGIAHAAGDGPQGKEGREGDVRDLRAEVEEGGPDPFSAEVRAKRVRMRRPSGRNALVVAKKHTPLASATATAPTATALSRSVGSAPCGEKPWYSATAAAGPSPTPRVIPSATYPCTSPWRPGGADSTTRVKNAVVPRLYAAPVRTRFVSTAQPAGEKRSAEAPASSTRESTRGPRRPKASTIHPANGRSASWATPIAPSMKPMPRASWPWSCRNRGSMAVTPKWTAVHSVSPLVRARTL